MSVVITTYTLASGLMQQGMTWCAGAHHHPARQRDRPDPDDPQRARRHEVRRVVSGVVPRRVRRARRERAGDPARDRRVRMVRHPDLDRRAGAADAADGGVAGVGERAGDDLDLVCDLLAGAGRDHHSRPRRHQAARGVVGAAAARRRCAAAVVGDRQRRRPGPHPVRSAEAAAGQHAVLDALSRGADRQRRLLGDAQPEHSRLHALRAEPALADARPGAGPAGDDDGICVSRRRGDERDDRDLRRGDLGSGRADRAHRQPDGRDPRRARGSRRADHDEHGRERRVARERLLEPRAEANQLRHRRADHRRPSASR